MLEAFPVMLFPNSRTRVGFAHKSYTLECNVLLNSSATWRARFHSALLRNKTYSGRVQKCNPLQRGVTDLSLQKVSGQGCGSIWPSWRHPRIFVPPVMRYRVQDGFWGPGRGGTAPRSTSIHPGQRGLRNGGGRGAKWEWAGCEMGEGGNPAPAGGPAARADGHLKHRSRAAAGHTPRRRRGSSRQLLLPHVSLSPQPPRPAAATAEGAGSRAQRGKAPSAGPKGRR